MTNKDVKFAAREAQAKESMIWMRANADRARSTGERDVIVNAQDLLDLCAYVESFHHREHIQFAGKRLGFCNPHDMRRLLSHDIACCMIRSARGSKYNTEVCFTAELPLPEELAKPSPEQFAEEVS